MSFNERYSEQIADKVDGAYVDESLLEMFTPENLEDISIDKWLHKELSDLSEAAITAAGYTPTTAKVFAEAFGHSVFTVAKEIVMTEKDATFAEKHGLSSMGIEQLGKKVAKGASKFFTSALNKDNLTVDGNTNCLFDEGAGDGTLLRPLPVSTATAGAWATWANMNTDITTLVSQHQAKNYNISNSIAFYPKSASLSMLRAGANFREASATEMLLGMGVLDVIAIPDAYFWTVANAAPVVGAFDIALVDMSQVKIGYTRPQRTRIIPPHDSVRDTIIECEVWFVPYFTPQPLDVAGTLKIYKGVSTITGINGA